METLLILYFTVGIVLLGIITVIKGLMPSSEPKGFNPVRWFIIALVVVPFWPAFLSFLAGIVWGETLLDWLFETV